MTPEITLAAQAGMGTPSQDCCSVPSGGYHNLSCTADTPVRGEQAWYLREAGPAEPWKHTAWAQRRHCSALPSRPRRPPSGQPQRYPADLMTVSLGGDTHRGLQAWGGLEDHQRGRESRDPMPQPSETGINSGTEQGTNYSSGCVHRSGEQEKGQAKPGILVIHLQPPPTPPPHTHTWQPP